MEILSVIELFSLIHDIRLIYNEMITRFLNYKSVTFSVFLLDGVQDAQLKVRTNVS